MLPVLKIPSLDQGERPSQRNMKIGGCIDIRIHKGSNKESAVSLTCTLLPMSQQPRLSVVSIQA
jgi:hypothetical protein